MKKILWTLSVVLILLIATGASADIRSDKCNTYSDDISISSVLDNYCAEYTRTSPKKNKQRTGDSSSGVRQDGC